MRTYSKKGSLQLSINAIVVLVLAIVMLGLGIKFTKDMLGSAGDQLMKKTDFESISSPTLSDPVTFEMTKQYVKHGKKSTFGMKILNPMDNPASVEIYSEKCGGGVFSSITGVSENKADLLSNDLGSGEKIDYAIAIDGSQEILKAAGGIQICDLNFIITDSDNPLKTKTIRKTITVISE